MHTRTPPWKAWQILPLLEAFRAPVTISINCKIFIFLNFSKKCFFSEWLVTQNSTVQKQRKTDLLIKINAVMLNLFHFANSSFKATDNAQLCTELRQKDGELKLLKANHRRYGPCFRWSGEGAGKQEIFDGQIRGCSVVIFIFSQIFFILFQILSGWSLSAVLNEIVLHVVYLFP